MSRGLLGHLLVFAMAVVLHAEPPVEQSPRTWRTFVETRSLGHERFLPFLEEARPEIVQIGNYGPMFHGYADNPKSKGWPLNLPVSGERACLEFQRKLNDQVHKLGLKVVGHYRLIKVMGDWEQRSGFVDYYDHHWPKELLGEKPHADVAELLQRDATGKPLQLARYEQAQLSLCLSSPHTRQMLKTMLKVAIDNGIDGVNTNFNYRYDCVCPHCQQAFKDWLKTQRSPEELAKLGIRDLAAHKFEKIAASIPGYPDPKAPELDWLAARWGAEHFKQQFDDIFLTYGRSLKKDLIVATWNHLGHVGLTEERALLPLPLWGRGEDYFWYSGGASFVGKNLNLAEHKAGDAWLSSLYLRELAAGKPFVMGKYEPVRMAVSMAEGFATGGLGMGRYAKFEDPAGYETLVRSMQFRRERTELFDNAVSYADAALVLPRQSILNRRPESLDAFRELGQALVERQVLLDVVADERIDLPRLSRYPAVIFPSTASLAVKQVGAIDDYAQQGGLPIVRGPFGDLDETGRGIEYQPIEGLFAISGNPSTNEVADFIVAKLRERGGSTIEAPWTVRAAAYSLPDRLTLHLVNYDRDETLQPKERPGPATERPRPVEKINVRFRLPQGAKAQSVVLHTPEAAEPSPLEFKASDQHVEFTVPRLLVYGVVEVRLSGE